MAKRYKLRADSLRLNGLEAADDADRLSGISEESPVQMGNGLFSYFLHDEYARKFRKMLTLEQYGDKELAALYSKQYADEPLAYQGALFSLLAQRGIFKPENPQITALHFYAPIYFLLALCDRQPEREKEAQVILEAHIRQFNKLYKKGD